MSQLRTHGSLGRLDDVRLATLVGRGDAAAFEALYDRHHASLLAFCRHMLGSREDGEDALQQTFLRAHRALSKGRPPAAVRAWLFAIARNRCLTLIAARRDAPVPVEQPESGSDDLAENVRRRAELRELVTDLRRLPDDQRAALVLSELGDLSHAEIGAVIGCPPKKVKALAFQAREALIADRDARCIPCGEIRGILETATGSVLRRASLRRHLRQCAPCDAYRLAVSGGRRGGLAALLPVAPTAGLKAAVLGGAGMWGGGESAAAAAAMAGAASAGGGAGSAVVAGVTLKAMVAKVAVTAAVAGAGVSGGLAVVDDPGPRALAAPPEAAAVPEATARTERARPAASRRAGAQLAPTVPTVSVPRPAARSPRLTPVPRRRAGARLAVARPRHARVARRRVRRALRRAAAQRISRPRVVRGALRRRVGPRRRARARAGLPAVRPRRARPAPVPTAAPSPSPTPTPSPTPDATPAEPAPDPITEG